MKKPIHELVNNLCTLWILEPMWKHHNPFMTRPKEKGKDSKELARELVHELESEGYMVLSVAFARKPSGKAFAHADYKEER